MANEPIITGTSFCLLTDHAPGPLDSDYGENYFWLDTATDRLYFSVDLTPENAVWQEVNLYPMAWVRFTGSTGAVLDSYNVTSVTRNSTGNYTVNLSITMPNANYAISTQSTGGGTITNYSTTTTTSLIVVANQIILGLVTPVDPTSMAVKIVG